MRGHPHPNRSGPPRPLRCAAPRFSPLDLLLAAEPHRRAVRGRDGAGLHERVRVHLRHQRAEGHAGEHAAQGAPHAVCGGAASVGEDGGTHEMLEDIALMRTMPNMKVMSTSDDTQTKWAVKDISKIKGPVYLRLSRLNTPIMYDENQKFEFGKAIQIGEGTDACIFATGVTVSEAIKAKEELEKQNINIRVVDFHTIKPIDEEIIIKNAKETKRLISIEDHNIIGGLGSAIAEILTEKYPAKLERMGINDCFGKSGKAEELMKYFKIDKQAIINKFIE